MSARVVLVVLFVSLVVRDASGQLGVQVVASGLSAPVAFAHDPLVRDTFYIAEQGGLVRTLVNGQLLSTPFIDLRPTVLSGGERGLLGMAFGPDGRVFFNFTNTAGHTVIARFRRDPASPRRADPASRLDLLWPTGERFIRQPFANHNGGHLEFGPDGMLYVGLGDGGSGNDPQNHAQNPASLLGKMLRIDVAVSDDDAVGYRVPAGNPFLDHQPIAALGEIWSFGLRNPWRYSFDVGPGATGALFIGDVGQNAREEINAEPPGRSGSNYGWRLREGFIATAGVPATTPAYEPLSNPIYDYGRAIGQAITGGYVYRGSVLGAAYRGRYFFADYVSARVWSLGWRFAGDAIAATDVLEHTAELGRPLGGIASFGRDGDGELYLLTFTGNVLKIVAAAGSAPSAPADLAAVVEGQAVSLSWPPPPEGAAGYQLEAGSTPGASDLAIVTTAHAGATFANVPDGTYYVRVRSVNAAGISPPSNEVVVVVGGAGCPRPLQPGALTASVTGRTVTLSWIGPPEPFLRYRIEAGSRTGLADLAVLMRSPFQRDLIVSAPPGTYYVRIRAVNSCGASDASNEIVIGVP